MTPQQRLQMLDAFAAHVRECTWDVLSERERMELTYRLAAPPGWAFVPEYAVEEVKELGRNGFVRVHDWAHAGPVFALTEKGVQAAELIMLDPNLEALPALSLAA